MAFDPIYMVAPDGRRALVGSAVEREQLLVKGYRIADDEPHEHVHWAGGNDVRTKAEFADDFDDEKAPEPKPEPAKPAAKDKPSVQAVNPAVETAKPATK